MWVLHGVWEGSKPMSVVHKSVEGGGGICVGFAQECVREGSIHPRGEQGRGNKRGSCTRACKGDRNTCVGLAQGLQDDGGALHGSCTRVCKGASTPGACKGGGDKCES